MEQIPIQAVTHAQTGTLVIRAGDGPHILVNSDLNNTIHLSQRSYLSNIDQTSIPLTPQSFLVVDGKDNVYAACDPNAAATLYKISGGLGFFQSGITSGGFRLGPKGFFIYSGTPALGNPPILSIVPPGVTTDVFGNAVKTLFATRDAATGAFVNLFGNTVAIGAHDNDPAASVRGGGGGLNINSGVSGIAGDHQIGIVMDSRVASVTGAIAQMCIGEDTPVANSAAMVEIQGPVSIVNPANLQVHALAAIQDDTTGLNDSAANFASLNPNASAVQVTGTETGKGTIKIAHHGYANGSDANAAGLSIDLQTTVGGITGSKAQGIFVTSTTDPATGDPMKLRFNGVEVFIVKAAGQVGIGTAIGHTPAGMLEITQKDTATKGIFMLALAGGSDMVTLRDSAGNSRVIVTNAGVLVIGAASAATGADLEVHSLIGILQQAPPGTPPSGYGYLYVNNTNGSLHYKGASGTDTQIAPG